MLACLEAGKPVLCEKPLATSAAAALRIVEAERGRGLVTVGFMRRFDPGYVDLKARLDAGEIGAPLLMHCAHRNVSVHDFFDSAMILTDSAVHEIDVARWLLDDEIARVTVLAPRPRPAAACATRSCCCSRRRAGGSSTSRPSSARATATTSAARWWGRTGRSSSSDPATGARHAIAADFRERFATAYRHELQAWVDGAARAERRGTATPPPRSPRPPFSRSRPAAPVDVRLA